MLNWKSLPSAVIVELTGVDESTARRYKRQRRAPEPVIRLIQLYLEGRVMPNGCGWQWARFEGDRLLVDEVEAYTVGELRALFWNRQRDALELQELRKRFNMVLRPRPVPAEPAPLAVVDEPPDEEPAALTADMWARRFRRW